jgi:PIN domain
VAFPAFLDTCVLYPAYLCDTLLRLAEAEAYRPLWSADVLAELHRNLIDNGVAPDRVDLRIAQMSRSFPKAAALRANAEVVVTFNVGDFPDQALKPFDVVAIHPDDFLLDQLDLYPGVTVEALRQQAAAYRREPTTVPGVLVRLERGGVPRFAAELRRHL